METGSKRGNTESMKVVINNIFRSIKGHPKENFIILVNMILCTMTVFVLLQNYYFLQEHFDVVYSENEVAHSSSPIGLGSFKNQELFKEHAYVDEGAYEYYQMTGEDGEYEFVDTMVVTVNADEVFGLKVMKGRFFEESDINTNDPDVPVPVVLCNDYAGDLDVGDVIELENDKAIVIGILEDNMYMSGWGAIEFIDDKIMSLCAFPRDFSMSVDDYNYRKFEIYDCVYCDDESVDVQKTINKITAENGYYTYQVTPIDGVEISETKDVSAKNVALIGLLALIACIICTCSLSSVLYNRTVQDRAVFSIYLCSGIPLWKINLSIIIEMVIFMADSSCKKILCLWYLPGR